MDIRLFLKGVFFFIFAMPLIAEAITLTGTGYGENEREAKNEALGDLSTNISSQVRKHIKSTASNQGKFGQVTLDVYSHLPIKTPEFKTGFDLGQSEAVASISTERTLQAYINELDRLKKNIQSLQATKDYQLLNTLLENIQSFNQHRLVADLLNENNQLLPSINITEADVLKRLRKQEKNISSLDQAGKMLSRGIDQKRIYLVPPKPSQSEDITQLSRQLKAQMSKHLSLVATSAKANYVMRGNYDIAENSLLVTVQLYDKYNRIIKTNTVKLLPKAYDGIAYQPTNFSFDQEVARVPEYAGNLYVKMAFRGYNTQDSVDLKKNSKVDLVLKTNQSICYYLVGNILHNNYKLSYLVPLSDGRSHFINRITGSDVNRAVMVLQGLEVSEPLGRESLQIFASTFDKNSQCPLVPPSCFVNEDGYCAISNDPKKALSNSRGLMTKKQTGKYEIQKTEAVLNFTTY